MEFVSSLAYWSWLPGQSELLPDYGINCHSGDSINEHAIAHAASDHIEIAAEEATVQRSPPV